MLPAGLTGGGIPFGRRLARSELAPQFALDGATLERLALVGHLRSALAGDQKQCSIYTSASAREASGPGKENVMGLRREHGGR